MLLRFGRLSGVHPPGPTVVGHQRSPVPFRPMDLGVGRSSADIVSLDGAFGGWSMRRDVNALVSWPCPPEGEPGQ